MRTLTVFIAVFILAGCSKTATICKKDGTCIDGRIENSDEKSVYVRRTRIVDGFSFSGTEYEENVKLSPDGKPQEVEFISYRDAGCLRLSVSRVVLARKKYTYDENGKIRTVEIDMGADGTVEKRKKYTWGDDGKLIKWEGDADADGPELMSMVKDSQAYVEAVDRSEIDEIDHPGNVAGIIGTALAPVSLAAIIIGIVRMADSDQCNGDDCGPVDVIGLFTTLSGFALAIPSAISTIWGWTTWSRSKSTAVPAEESLKPEITPLALTSGDRTYWGLGMSWRW